MSTSPSIPSGGGGELQPSDSAEAGELKIPPGYGYPQIPPSPIPSIDAIRSRLESIEDSAADVERQAAQRVAEAMDGPDGLVRELEARLLGRLETRLDRAEAQAAKISGKIRRFIEGVTGSAHAYAGMTGYPYLSMEEIVADLSSPGAVLERLPGGMGRSPEPPPIVPPGESPSPPFPQSLPPPNSTRPTGRQRFGPGGQREIELEYCYLVKRPDGTTGSHCLSRWVAAPSPEGQPGAIGPPAGGVRPSGQGFTPPTPVPGPGGLPSTSGGGLWIHFQDRSRPPAPWLAPTPIVGDPCGLAPHEAFLSPVGPGQSGAELKWGDVWDCCDGLWRTRFNPADPWWRQCPGEAVQPAPEPGPEPGPEPAPCPPCEPAPAPAPAPVDPCQPAPKLPDCPRPEQGVPREIPSKSNACEWIEALRHYSSDRLSIEDTARLSLPKQEGAGLSATIANAFHGVIIRLAQACGRWADEALGSAVGLVDCKDKGVEGLTLTSFWSGFLSRWLGIDLHLQQQQIHDGLNGLCQTLWPSGPAADRARLTGVIGKTDWECWHKIAGDRIPEAELVYQSLRTKPSPLELTILGMRGRLKGKELQTALEHVGVINAEDRDRLRWAAEAWPGLADIIRFMVRDVADESVLGWDKADALFPLKWKGRLKELANGLGISDEMAKYYWRAHFALPSPTALYEMLHRLRPGTVNAEIATTESQVRDTLIQQDIHPFWVDRLMAVSYHPLTRTDVIRAFEIGSLDEAGLRGALQDEGYDARPRVDRPSDVDTLVAFYRKQKSLRTRRRLGLASPGAWVRRYVRGEVTAQQLEAVLERQDYSPEEIREILGWALEERSVAARAGQIRQVKRRYERGLLDYSEAVRMLLDLDIEGGQADELVAGWASRPPISRRETTAAQLCRFRERGIIGETEQIDGLLRLGYTQENVRRIISDCAATVSSKRAKELASQLEKLARQREKEEKEARARAKELEKKLSSRNGQPAGASGESPER